jgi:hypothetical protein
MMAGVYGAVISILYMGLVWLLVNVLSRFIAKRIANRRRKRWLESERHNYYASERQLLIGIYFFLARGESCVLTPPRDKKIHFAYARILHEIYGIDSGQVLEETGWWPEDEKEIVAVDTAIERAKK